MKAWKVEEGKNPNESDNFKETINIVKCSTSSGKSKSPSSLIADFKKLPPSFNNAIIRKVSKSMTPPFF